MLTRFGLINGKVRSRGGGSEGSDWPSGRNPSENGRPPSIFRGVSCLIDKIGRIQDRGGDPDWSDWPSGFYYGRSPSIFKGIWIGLIDHGILVRFLEIPSFEISRIGPENGPARERATFRALF